uniref:Protein-serine/threonine phosphatase n=1 Tax=Rhabditophanes sp. KR3021 TaxID=114890 RepID=A0AC35U913_9BILA
MSISLAPAVVEKKKQPNDDYVKIIRQNDLSEERIAKIEIPVKEAIILDPDFRPSSEHQIIQMVIKNKNVEEMDVGDVMTQLCKKLAEKRVFGQSLMADLTVAGPNHSTYNNLPLEGIIYIQDVCRKVLYNRVGDDNEFWDVFRESMRKLAARCRRVRHSRKSKSKTDSNIPMKREATADMVLRHEVMSDSSTDSGHDINALNSSGETSQT